jgi:hypothetical protein
MEAIRIELKEVHEFDRAYNIVELNSQVRMCIKELSKEHNECKYFLPSKEIAVKFNIDRFGSLNTLLSMFEKSIK